MKAFCFKVQMERAKLQFYRAVLLGLKAAKSILRTVLGFCVIISIFLS